MNLCVAQAPETFQKSSCGYVGQSCDSCEICLTTDCVDPSKRSLPRGEYSLSRKVLANNCHRLARYVKQVTKVGTLSLLEDDSEFANQSQSFSCTGCCTGNKNKYKSLNLKG